MNGEQKKFLDENGLKILWNQISMHDYPNNAALTSVINAIDANKADKADIPRIDTTLSAAGAAADAKAVGEAIENIELTPGPKGDSGVYVGTYMPTDESVNVWINPNGESIDVPLSGGNTSICNFTITTEQDVNAITVELPTTFDKFYALNFFVEFPGGLTEPLNLYTHRNNGKDHAGYGILAAGTVFYSLSFSGYRDNRMNFGYASVSAGGNYPKMPNANGYLSPNVNSITFYSKEETVNFPVGTRIDVWGVYKQ